MTSFLTDNNILNPEQSGFRKLYSTSTAVTQVSDFILEEMGKNKYVGAVLIDLKKAFDTVDHKILLKKLFCYGFRNAAFSWLESYLSDRRQVTLVNNWTSDVIAEGSYGVPQGSVLGPLLFLVYINDLKSAIQLSFFHLYADDTIIICSCDSTQELKLSLEQDLKDISNWLKLNKLTINTSKTEVIFFGNKSRLKSCNDVAIRYDGIPLVSKSKVKYLGVVFDKNLSWKNQIKSLVGKSYHKLSKIRYISSNLTSDTKNLLVNALVMPYLYYCSSAWCNANKSVLNKADKLYKNISTFINKPHIELENLLNFNHGITIFKSIHKTAPSYLSEKVALVKSSHSHNTRAASDYMLTMHPNGSRFFRRSFKFRSPRLWNSLPSELRTLQSLLQFKEASSKHFKLRS